MVQKEEVGVDYRIAFDTRIGIIMLEVHSTTTILETTTVTRCKFNEGKDAASLDTARPWDGGYTCIGCS